MRVLLFALTFCFYACAPIQVDRGLDEVAKAEPDRESFDQVDRSAYDERYNELLGEIRDDLSVESLQELRRAYIYTSYYEPYSMAERALTQGIFESLGEKDWESCLKLANELLEMNYISLSSHLGSMVCAFELGQESIGEYHRSVLDGLVESIRRSGDGVSPDTAFFITSTHNLYTFVQLNGLEVVSQALVHGETSQYDLMTVKDPESGDQFNWYFDITAQKSVGFRGLGSN